MLKIFTHAQNTISYPEPMCQFYVAFGTPANVDCSDNGPKMTRSQVSVYRTIGPLVGIAVAKSYSMRMLNFILFFSLFSGKSAVLSEGVVSTS